MIGIIGAMEDEVLFLRSAIEMGHSETIGGFEMISGVLENKQVVLLRCGIGKVNAAVGCTVLINRHNPVLVINTGSAGGIDPALRFGDAVISEGLVYHDADVTAFGYVPGRIPGCPPVFPVAEDLIRLAEQAVEELKQEGTLPADFRHCRGLIGSGDVFVHKPEHIAVLRELFPN
jgi:adenosylhomocysteine nucleosidase